MLTTQKQIRAAFWESHPNFPRRWVNGSKGYPIRPQNYQPADTRCAFVEFVDYLERSGQISESLAQRVTL